ncbi:NAD(P)-dependent oxidoreductase [Neoasaia chiangmaiensis]|uniref:6-phosphogluconate dehydrogenase n=1 Tax=Neoasaia chiangmaiensis TaxID=320497 RepID=A0A1U9KRY1_9PROT|nr:NAD(P)-dependent oxidoreductase [Neoasaia chiangmaiensis]AQS88586.1 6-phosphogluconate dehydrogenase [Neoasaia chiangmaiensis]
MKIGFVGLGAMGEAMAMCLLKAGHELAVYNRSPQKADRLVEEGAQRADSPSEAARGRDIVFSMLLDDDAVASSTFDENGIMDGLSKDAVHVGCSTISHALAIRLRDEHAARGQTYASATVLGRPPAAQAGELFVILAGAAAAREKVRPALDAFSQRIFEVGSDPAHANIVKLSLNFMIFSTIQQMAEVFSINEKAGIEPKAIFEILTNSFYTAPVHRNYGKIMVEKDYDKPGAPMSLGLKDAELFLAAGGDLRVPLPTASLIRDRFLTALAAGDDRRDFSALFEYARRDAGLTD